MWFNTNTQAVYRSHAEIRAAFPNTSFPSVISNETLMGFGLLPVTLAAHPEYDPLMQALEEAPPAQVDGAWTQQWVVRDLTPEELKARVPTVVTMRQARLALLQSGLLSQVEAALSAIEDPAQRQAVQIEWEYAAEVDMTHPWVQALTVSLGLTEAQIDSLFMTASGL
jgi:hypothetical protein